MNISLPKPAQLLKLATNLAGSGLGGPIGAALSGVLKMGQSVGTLKSTLAKLQSSQQGSNLKPGAQVASQPQPFSLVNINVTVMQNPAQAASQSPSQRFQMAPIVGNDSQWPGFSQAANSRITGNSNGLFDGSNPWAKSDGRTEERAAVGWVMQQNDSLRYDADKKMFYSTAADGTRTDKLSLDKAIDTIRSHGGASPSAGAAFRAVGKLANEAANSGGAATPQKSAFQPLMDMFKQVMNLFQQLLGGQAGQAAGAAGNGFNAGNSISQLFSGPGGGSLSGASNSGAAPSSAGWGTPSGASSPSGSSAPSGGSAPGGGNLDSMMSQAESLLKSDKMEDQIKGQKLMQQAMRMFELISKMIEKQSEMASKAIAAIK